jgi:hypothetical protein
MCHKQRTKVLGPTKRKGGEKKLAHKASERMEAQKKADVKYFAVYVVYPLILLVLLILFVPFSNREVIREKNRLRMQRHHARER